MCSLDVFYRQIKFYHWIIKGQNYIATHRFLDEVAQMISGKIDLFAERLVYLKFTPEYEPTIVESKSEVKYVVSPLATTNEIIDNLLKQFDIVLSNLKESANKSIYDYGTQQFVTEVIYDVEVFKHHIESFKE
ncbi:DNA protection during starvation protein [compost metagenome]